MKKLAVCCLALTLPLSLIAADRDVNRDGWINQADVTALARMVAGIDPVDLRYDQDGDGALTLEDVNHVLDATAQGPISSSTTTATPHTPPPSQSTGGMDFYAVRQKGTGQCVVVVGNEGISPGDTLFGVFPSFPEAQDLLTSRCNQGPATPTSTNIVSGLPLSTDRLYRPDKTITRGKWGTATHIGGDANLKSKVNERGFVVEDGFFVAPGHGGDTEILWSHDGSETTLSGAATVIDCIDYCGRAGSIEFFIRGDGRDLWAGGLVRQGDPARTFSVSLSGIHEVRLVITDGGNGVDEDWGGWLNLKVGAPGAPPAAATAPPSLGRTTQGAFPPILAIPKFDNDDSTRGIFSIELESGKGTLINRVRKTPLDVQIHPMRHNFFQAIGRRPGQSALQGQILIGPIRKGGGRVHALLIVDTTTGKMGYLTDLDDDPARGKLKMIDGAPAQAMATEDGNYALVMRRSGSGKTLGAYLYHGTTGRCRIFKDIGNLSSAITSSPTTTLPKIDAGVSSLEIQAGSDATSNVLLIDPSSGTLYLIGDIEHKPTQLTVRTLSLNIVEAFPQRPKVLSPQRFLPIPITDRSGATSSALIVDVGSGALALLDNIRKPSKIRMIGIKGSIYDVLKEDVGRPRTITAVPKIDDTGATEAAWLFDSATGTILFINNLQDPGNLVLRLVNKRNGD